MSKYIQSNQIVLLPYADLTISAADSGKIHITPQTAGGITPTYTLPTREAGLHYRFINGAANPLNGSVAIVAEAGTIFGHVMCGPVDGVKLKNISGDGQMDFHTGDSVLGDSLDFTCDGTHWFVDGRSSVANGII